MVREVTFHLGVTKRMTSLFSVADTTDILETDAYSLPLLLENKERFITIPQKLYDHHTDRLIKCEE